MCEEMVFYVPGSYYVESFAKQVDGVYVSGFEGKTLEELRMRQPTIVLIPYSEAAAMISEAEKIKYSGIKKVDSDRFNEMLDVLPPMNWRTYRGAESFLLCEADSGYWHLCLMRVGDNYYEGYSNCTTETVEGRTDRFMAAIRENRVT